jgi:hypothetical protein
MREQKILSPENYDKMIENSNDLQSAGRVKGFIDSYKNQPRYNEDAMNFEQILRERITK